MSVQKYYVKTQQRDIKDRIPEQGLGQDMDDIFLSIQNKSPENVFQN